MSTVEVPVAIELRADRLQLQWAEGRADLSALHLRTVCRCAGCRAALLRGEPIAPQPLLRLTGVEPVGRYGLQLCFSDGHDRGIYPWEWLRELSRHASAT